MGKVSLDDLTPERRAVIERKIASLQKAMRGQTATTLPGTFSFLTGYDVESRQERALLENEYQRLLDDPNRNDCAEARQQYQQEYMARRAEEKTSELAGY